jgi:membrane AbrB-like protein
MSDPQPPENEKSPPAKPAPRRRIGDLIRLPRTATAIWLGTIVATYAIGFASGWLGSLAHMPLPYVLGPLAATACLGFAGLQVQAVRRIRPAAQFAIGSAIGIQFTRAIVVKLLVLLPLIVGSALLAILVCAVAAALLMALTGLDRKTAFFATAPAGAAEMANIAARYGGAPEPIMVSQTMRVVLVVSAAPFMVIHFSHPDALHPVAQIAVLSLPSIALLALCSAVGGLLVTRTGFPNGWFMGSLIASAIVGTAGLMEGRLPDPLLTVAQVMIGCSLGAQFRREFLTRLLPQMLASTVTVVFALAAMAAFAAGFAYLFALPVPTMVLALAPAGMAEMTLTGKVLGLDAALISGFHTVRIILVMLLCVPAYRLFDWLLR